ncbi:MAG: 16S rRNA (guanine(966)-N(2))-methyltransferase RsmD [Phycisphaerae bacterium]|jgi:16S rRNA (guanine966-N2)-methyltransferase
MRIIAGTKRGLKLQSPEGDVSRPIIDRVKESLFSVLYGLGLPNGAMAADLFSGVGSLGLESLSRGAEFVTFVERDPRVGSILNNNIEKAGFAGQSKVVRANAFKVGAPVGDSGRRYDLVFVDPPYPTTKDVSENSQLAGLMDVLAGQVTDNALVIVRTQEKVELLDEYGAFKVLQRRTWGSMNVTLLKKTITAENAAVAERMKDE